MRLSFEEFSPRGVIAAAAVALAATGCSRGRAARPPVANAAVLAPDTATSSSTDFLVREDARGITTAAVTAEPMPDYLEVAGRIQADPTRVVRVYPPVSGRLVSVDVRPADYVEQGQVLAVLASSDVAVARAAYRQAQADAHVKRQALERARLLYDNHVIALRDYQQAQADAVSAEAMLESAVERLELLNVDTAVSSDQLPVRAPRAGVVTDLQAAPGEYSKSLDNSNPLCTIADLSTVWAVGDVYEKDVASVKVGDSARVITSAYPTESRRGRVTAISSTVDTTTRALKVRVVLANPGGRLKPDMFATIRVVRAVRTAVLVPQSALVREGASAYLFVQTAPGRYQRRAVTVGSDVAPNRVEVTSGLAPGDTVVIEGAELLRAATTSS
ncbi:MAG TPA: efflux RND transporter periplasmic adaptor subunit [Gemmatimonadales bacterium]|nr:efflux RND transporter periplasmic adaptor subunit [Gemmatimonadales bacterium]